MRISFFIGGLSNGGAERVTCNLANYMLRAGHDVTIVTMADDEPTYNIEEGIQRVTLLESTERRSFVINSLRRLRRFHNYLRGSNTEVYVVMLPVTTIMLLGMKRFTKAKIIAAERSYPAIYSSRIQYMLRSLARKADGWVFQTPGQKEWYSSSGIQNDIIIPNAINPAFIRPQFTGDRKKRIVTVGSLTKPKNHELLINAFSAISKEFPDYKLVIFGEGSKRDILHNLVKELGVEKQVDLPGYSSNITDDIIDSTLYVLSSDYEGMPNSLLEAMALGLPCISTDCDGGGARLLIENEVNGLLVPKGDEIALGIAMRRLLTDTDLAVKCSKNARAVCEKLSPDVIYSEWENYIKNIIRKEKV